MSTGFRIRQLATAALAINAVRPPTHHWAGGIAMLPGWLASELAPQLLALGAVDSVRELARGRGRRDKVGLALAAVGGVALGRAIAESTKASRVLDDALRPLVGAAHQPVDPLDSVEVIKDIAYGAAEHQTLDIHRPAAGAKGAPVLLQIHGGMWMYGDKGWDARPLMRRMAARGWVVVSINYAFAPKHPLPTQVVDVKKAIAWIREEIDTFGGDASFLAVTGGSAGGHLAAMAATTANAPEFQPGFEEADTSVQAAVPLYGIYDLAAAAATERATERRDRFLAPKVLVKSVDTDLASFETVSPAGRAGSDVPPIFLLHGLNDTGVEAAEGLYFAERLRAVSQQPVVFAGLPGAQHAFDTFWSIRTLHTVRAIERFLTWALEDHRTRR